MNAIELERVSKNYPDLWGRPRVQAVDNVSFTVQAGEIFGFLGPNGAGKTTTVKMICGLVEPTAGIIRVQGLDIARHKRDVLTCLSTVLEGNRNIYWRLTPRENLAYFAALKGLGRREVRHHSSELLQLLELSERANDVVGEFSRGMQQKVALAVALISNPDVLLLDEPTLGLDVQAALTIKRRMVELAHQQGKAVLLTTHQMALAQEVCDRVAIINRGRIVAQGTVADLIGLFVRREYRFEVEGQLSAAQEQALAYLGPCTVNTEGAITRIDLLLSEPSQVYAAIDVLREERTPLINVQRQTPDLSEVFVRLVSGEMRAGEEAQ